VPPVQKSTPKLNLRTPAGTHASDQTPGAQLVSPLASGTNFKPGGTGRRVVVCSSKKLRPTIAATQPGNRGMRRGGRKLGPQHGVTILGLLTLPVEKVGSERCHKTERSAAGRTTCQEENIGGGSGSEKCNPGWTRTRKARATQNSKRLHLDITTKGGTWKKQYLLKHFPPKSWHKGRQQTAYAGRMWPGEKPSDRARGRLREKRSHNDLSQNIMGPSSTSRTRPNRSGNNAHPAWGEKNLYDWGK